MFLVLGWVLGLVLGIVSAISTAFTVCTAVDDESITLLWIALLLLIVTIILLWGSWAFWISGAAAFVG
jgi:hypothetical protein